MCVPQLSAATSSMAMAAQLCVQSTETNMATLPSDRSKSEKARNVLLNNWTLPEKIKLATEAANVGCQTDDDWARISDVMKSGRYQLNEKVPKRPDDFYHPSLCRQQFEQLLSKLDQDDDDRKDLEQQIQMLIRKLGNERAEECFRVVRNCALKYVEKEQLFSRLMTKPSAEDLQKVKLIYKAAKEAERKAEQQYQMLEGMLKVAFQSGQVAVISAPSTEVSTLPTSIAQEEMVEIVEEEEEAIVEEQATEQVPTPGDNLTVEPMDIDTDDEHDNENETTASTDEAAAVHEVKSIEVAAVEEQIVEMETTTADTNVPAISPQPTEPIVPCAVASEDQPKVDTEKITADEEDLVEPSFDAEAVAKSDDGSPSIIVDSSPEDECEEEEEGNSADTASNDSSVIFCDDDIAQAESEPNNPNEGASSPVNEPSSRSASDYANYTVDPNFKRKALIRIRQMSEHRHSVIFSEPIIDPEYDKVIFNKTDLATIKRQVEWKTTDLTKEAEGLKPLTSMEELRREIYRMLTNAIYYNKTKNPDMEKKALEMYNEVQSWWSEETMTRRQREPVSYRQFAHKSRGGHSNVGRRRSRSSRPRSVSTDGDSSSHEVVAETSLTRTPTTRGTRRRGRRPRRSMRTSH